MSRTSCVSSSDQRNSTRNAPAHTSSVFHNGSCKLAATSRFLRFWNHPHAVLIFFRKNGTDFRRFDVVRIPAAQRFHFGRVAQLAEHSALNRQVVGSIPTASTIK